MVFDDIVDRPERLEQRDRPNGKRQSRRNPTPSIVDSDGNEVDNVEFEEDRPRRDRYE